MSESEQAFRREAKREPDVDRFDYALDRLLNSRFVDPQALEAVWRFVDGETTKGAFDEAMS